MKKALLLLLLFFCTYNYISAQKTNINLSNEVIFDGEPFMAVNPANPKNIVVAWMGVNNLRIGIKVRSSFDGGKTWSNYVLMPHGALTWHSADVSMAFDRNGLLYMSYIDYRQNPDSGGVYIAHSKDGGLTWSTPSRVWSVNESPKMPIDRPWLAIDNSTSATAGTLYITSKPPSWVSLPNRPYLKYSTDSGKTWSAYRYVDTTGYSVGNIIAAPMATVNVSTNGRLNMVYPSYLASQSVYPQYFCATSFDRGTHLKYTTALKGSYGVTDTLVKLGYRLSCDPVDSNKMCLAITGELYSDPDIFVVTTADGGHTWSSTPVRVNDDTINNGKWQDMVWASYDTTGRLLVTWRDRRLSKGSGFFVGNDFYGAVSNDNGATFGKNFRLSDTTAAFDSILMQNGNDFMCNQLYRDTAYAAWGDTRNGYLNIYFVKRSINGTTSVQQVIAHEPVPVINIVPYYGTHTMQVLLPGDIGDDIEVHVYDMTGKLIVSAQGATRKGIYTIKMPPVSTGIYVVDVTTEQGSLSKKVYWENR